MRIGVTGHRPVSMPSGYDEKHDWVKARKMELQYFLLEFEAKNRIDHFVSGGALGGDMWVAELGLIMRYGVKAYLPHIEQASRWPKEASERYVKLLSHPFTDIVICGAANTISSYHKRDRDIVDDSDIILTLWNPKKEDGGTYNTLKYCREKYPEKQIINFWK